MNKIIIEEVYTGGGCEHLSIQFIDYGVQFDIMNADEYSANQLPENGKPFCFNLRKTVRIATDADYIETSDRIENYHSETIKDFCFGYLAALKIKPIVEAEPEPYDLDGLFSSITDIYQQYDEGSLSKSEANRIAKMCCEAFIDHYELFEEGK
jgi:hypothetical protein